MASHNNQVPVCNWVFYLRIAEIGGVFHLNVLTNDRIQYITAIPCLDDTP